MATTTASLTLESADLFEDSLSISNTTTLHNYENSKKLKTNKKDFFSFFKNISNVQELWIKAILFDKNYFLVPLSTKLQNLANYRTLLNLVINKAAGNKSIQEIISGMLTKEIPKEKLSNPMFYLKLFFS